MKPVKLQIVCSLIPFARGKTIRPEPREFLEECLAISPLLGTVSAAVIPKNGEREEKTKSKNKKKVGSTSRVERPSVIRATLVLVDPSTLDTAKTVKRQTFSSQLSPQLHF